MEIKGTAVKSIPDFIKKNYPDHYQDWIGNLPFEAKKVFNEGVITSKWYPLDEAAVIPTKAIGDIVFNGDHRKAAWEAGRFSAESALNGIYKLYVKMSSPGHIITRAGRVFSAYYQPSEITVLNHKKTSVDVHITKFLKPNEIVEHRIAGWIERALEISGCHDVKVKIQQSMSKGAKLTEICINWS